MSPSSPARRISYVIPPPAQSIPRLVLPRLGADRHGSTIPLFITASSEKSTDLSTPPPSNVEFGVHLHPKHRLGITSFALDTSTRLSGKPTPEGILYSGGRDGQVLAHELGIGLKQRSKPYGVAADGKGSVRSWETITGWGDLEESIEEEQMAGTETAIPFENNWEIDPAVKEPSLNISFRQSVQSHSDWINDIVLCNFNRTIVSCSSDETVKAWNPHDGSGASDTVVLGRHMDYVQCLANAKQQEWVASGGFDRMIKLWDLTRERQDPIITFSPPEESNTKASVYAIATDAAGSFIASGSPEKVIRLWDPRSGKRTGKLVGHTDNIRSILISEDGRYVLTGSADASIKLWSLASANRCIHTFSHHTDSVWSLQSSHPSLSIFYSGDRSGHVCRVDTEGCASLSEGECVLLCNETPSAYSLGTEGITSLQVLDDQFVWTATSSSTINCWRVPGTRSSRIAEFGTSPGEVEMDTSPSTASDFANTVSPYGFSMDSIQPSTLRSRQRESFNVEKESWPRSDSPSSLPDAPMRNVESPSGIRSRNTVRGSTLMNRESSTLLNPSNSSVYTATGPPQAAPATQTTLFGVPYQSLIKLSSPADGFVSPLFGRVNDPDVATLYSAASIKSVPIPMRQLTLMAQAESFRPINLSQPSPGLNSVLQRSVDGNTFGSAISTGQQGHRAVQSVEEIEDAARIAYETREIAPEALPVRDRPDYVLQGTQGIVRSIVLNDRWHALTVDTMGHVGVWDIVRGECVGMFEKCDVEKATESESASSDGQKWKWSPREALEVVRERIEGEAVVNAWCTVDSSIGNLMVHIESNRAFDAEIFADEAGYEREIKLEDDHRLNIGKWVIGNLFASFVVQEQAVQAEPGYFVDMLTSEPLQSPPGLGRAGISRQGGPRHISLEARRIRSIAEIAASQRTPGIAASAAILTMTPAVLPDLPINAMEKIAAASARPSDGKTTKLQEHGDQNDPNPGESHEAGGDTQSPSIGSPTPKVPQHSQAVDEASPGHVDYFSVRRKSSVGGEENAGAEIMTEGATIPPQEEEIIGPGAATTQPASLMTPTTPAISGPAVASLKFMGKLKAFGKQKKTGGPSETTESSDAMAVASNADSEAAVIKPPTPTVFELLMSKPLILPTFSDVPPIEINPMTGLIISQASSEAASGWAPVYRGLYSTQSEPEDVEILEQEIPGWILEFLLNNKVGGVVGGGGPSGTQKFNFMVVPWKGGDSPSDLPELLSSQSRLTASRFLRVRKILSYVKDKVDSIEKADKRKEAELYCMGEEDAAGPPSRTGTPRVPSPKSLKSSRSSHDGSTVPLHRPNSKPTPGGGTSVTPPPGHTPRPRATSSSSSRSGTTVNHHTSSRNRKASRATIEEEKAAEKRPEELYELLCNGMLLPNEMTLAAVKQYRWKGAGELVMEYRRRDYPRLPVVQA